MNDSSRVTGLYAAVVVFTSDFHPGIGIGVRRQLVSREPQKQYAVPRVNSKCRELSPKTEEGSWRVVLREMTRGSLADVETLEQTSEVENGGGVVPRAEVGMTDAE